MEVIIQAMTMTDSTKISKDFNCGACKKMLQLWSAVQSYSGSKFQPNKKLHKFQAL